MTPAALLNAVSGAMLRRLDPELAHDVAILALRLRLAPPTPSPVDPRLATEILGLTVPNPVGHAAGFDKNGEAVDGLLGLGFGFVEIGTVTPLPQPGNPKPRLFRLPAEKAVINRFGFNGAGEAAVAAKLLRRAARGGIVGVNVGANKTSTDRVADYVSGIRRFAPLASYLAVNVSSPNTPGLRDLQARSALDDLLARVVAARDETVAAAGRRVPVLLKIAPDVSEQDLDDIAAVVGARGVDGLIVSNTTLSRAGVSGPVAAEAGGLSGRPLYERSTIVLAKTRQRVGPALPIIGVGGVFDAADVVGKIAAGADLVEVYTAFIYASEPLVPTIVRGLSAHLDRTGAATLRDLRDGAVAEWASRPIPS